MMEVSREVYLNLIKTLKVSGFVLIDNYALVIGTGSLKAFQM